MNMTAIARQCMNHYHKSIAHYYQVDNVSEQFAVTQVMDTKLRAAMLESVEFLGMITMLDVDQMKGQVVSVGSYNIATGRNASGRFTSGQSVDGNQYELVETDSCAYVTWAQMAAWANSGTQNQFASLMSANATNRFALDILRIGFNGTSVAATTDPVANPLGEDVNIGWHAHVKADAPEQVVTDDIYFNFELPVGTEPKAGEYRTIDAAVTELKALLHPSIRNDPRLRVLIGSDLVSASQSRLMNQANTPTEKVAAQQLDKNIGGLIALQPPFFPGKRLVVTIPTNLHYYKQKGTSSRMAENVQDRKRHEDKYWRMDGYVVEEYEAYAAIDEANVTIGAAPDA
ncbi:phage major capsid protein, P2 family [Shewanella sp.]|uniref:phage major capsid protein, P2 family n=1 Tax=Shewanella sp. TaxID=50422 RepID=UPI003A97013C